VLIDTSNEDVRFRKYEKSGDPFRTRAFETKLSIWRQGKTVLVRGPECEECWSSHLLLVYLSYKLDDYEGLAEAEIRKSHDDVATQMHELLYQASTARVSVANLLSKLYFLIDLHNYEAFQSWKGIISTVIARDVGHSRKNSRPDCFVCLHGNRSQLISPN
jgi:hypothetical protein